MCAASGKIPEDHDTMAATAQKETRDFQAEVSQVLNLVIRSLYSNKEIFLRELISNASDAAEKLRFEALGNDGLYEDDANLKIRISVDKAAGTLSISDNGIGMSRQEVTETIGSIASSGTKKFLENLSGDQAKDSQLIGQFGVGFYSAFIVADKVTLTTRRADLPPELVIAESEGVEIHLPVDPEKVTAILYHPVNSAAGIPIEPAGRGRRVRIAADHHVAGQARLESRVLGRVADGERRVGFDVFRQVDLGLGDMQETPGTASSTLACLGRIQYIVGWCNNIFCTFRNRTQTGKWLD